MILFFTVFIFMVIFLIMDRGALGSSVVSDSL